MNALCECYIVEMYRGVEYAAIGYGDAPYLARRDAVKVMSEITHGVEHNAICRKYRIAFLRDGEPCCRNMWQM